MRTLIVNAFGGPGVGKTTCCWEIASELKKRGIITEYVSEYAKEYSKILRVAEFAAKSAYKNARIFLSLSNRWVIPSDTADKDVFGAKEFLTELNASLIRRENPNYCLLQNYTSYEEAIEWVKNIEENDCRLLSHFPKYVDKAGNVITFDDAF